MQRFTSRQLLAFFLVAFGAIVVAYGFFLSIANTRTSAEDDLAWAIFSMGGMILGAGVYLPVGGKVNWGGVALATVLSPIALFAMAVAFYWFFVLLATIREVVT